MTTPPLPHTTATSSLKDSPPVLVRADVCREGQIKVSTILTRNLKTQSQDSKNSHAKVHKAVLVACGHLLEPQLLGHPCEGPGQGAYIAHLEGERGECREGGLGSAEYEGVIVGQDCHAGVRGPRNPVRFDHHPSDCSVGLPRVPAHCLPPPVPYGPPKNCKLVRLR